MPLPEPLVYVVEFCTGEYSELIERPVCCYDNQYDADEHARRANAWLMRQGDHQSQEGRNSVGYSRKPTPNPFDPGMDFIDYTGANYIVYAVPLRKTVPIGDGLTR